MLSQPLMSGVLCALLLSIFVLAGCGGGGGGGGGTIPDTGNGGGSNNDGNNNNNNNNNNNINNNVGSLLTDRDFFPSNFMEDVSAGDRAVFSTNPQYDLQPGLAMINADWAYARGAANMANDDLGSGTGAGVMVGVVDSGLDHRHPEFLDPGLSAPDYLGPDLSEKVDRQSVLTYSISTATQLLPTSTGIITETNSEVEDIDRYPVLVCDVPGRSDSGRDCPLSQAPLLGSTHISKLDGTMRRLPFAPFVVDAAMGQIDLGPDDANLTHGTAVSGYAVARRGAADVPPRLSDIHGVAYQAGLLFMAVDFFSGESVPISTLDQETADVVNFFNGASAVVNISYNFISNSNQYTPDRIRSFFPQTIPAMLQASVDEADRTIYVVAAGNAYDDMPANSTSPETLGMLPYAEDTLQGQFLTVISVDTATGIISDFSNRCGLARAWCIAAPGEGIVGVLPQSYDADEDGFFANLQSSGTSFAAPHVTGAIAVLIDFFGGRIGNTEIVRRLLATADNSAPYADAALYGQGLLDLKAATEPMGTMMMLTGNSLAGPAVPAAATRLFNAAAFGDAWVQAFQSQRLSIFDQLDAPFPALFADFVSSPADGLIFEAALLRLGEDDLPFNRLLDNGVSLSFSERDDKNQGAFLARGLLGAGNLSDQRSWFASYGLHPAYAFSPSPSSSLSPTRKAEFMAPWADFATDGMSIGAMMPLGGLMIAMSGFMSGFEGFNDELDDYSRDDNRIHNQGLLLSLSSSDVLPFHFGVQFGLVNESNGLVGSSGIGALKLGDNMQTWFAGGTTGWRLGAWEAIASAYIGVTQPDEVSGSLFIEMSSLVSTTMSVGMTRPNLFARGDRLSFLLTQPLRVESGAAQLRFAASRTRYRDVILDELKADLAPSGREIELEASYLYPISSSSRLALAASLIRERGHSKDAPLEARMIARWGIKF